MRARVRCIAVLMVGSLGIIARPGEVAAQSDNPAAEAAPEATPAPDKQAPAPTEVAPSSPTAPAPEAVTHAAPVVLPPPPVAAPMGSLKIDNAGNTIKFGLLAQPQYEAAGAPAGSGMSSNLYLRRIRLLVGGTLFGDLEYFFETDSPNMFKAAPDGVRGTSAMVVQDAFVTYKILKDMVKVDAGFMLPPLSHNAVQGAGTLYGVDYFANSFLHTNVFGQVIGPVGRDLGFQLRGLLLDGLVEYRVGMFQGKRNEQSPPPAAAGAPPVVPTDVAARNFFRVAGRLQVNFLDPETSFFYSGTYLGAKRILSVGGSYDFQYTTPDSYKYWAVDGFLDLPAGPGAVTAQANLAQWNGGTIAPTLTKRTAVMAEAGYRIADIKLSPIGRFEELWVPSTTGGATAKETRFGGGLAWWAYGHNSNLKAFVMRVKPDPGTQSYNLVNVQWQVFFF